MHTISMSVDTVVIACSVANKPAKMRRGEIHGGGEFFEQNKMCRNWIERTLHIYYFLSLRV